MKLSNKKTKYIRRHAGEKTPEEIAADLKIRLKDVQRVLKQFEKKLPSGNTSTSHIKGSGPLFPQHLISILIICLLGLAVYGNTFNSPFIFDDKPNIELNPYLRIDSFDFQSLYEAVAKSPCPNRPVANISFALNYYWGQYNVLGYHIINTAIHLINGIIVYFLSILIFSHTRNIQEPNRPPSKSPSIPIMSLFAALIFICHPIQTQSVTYLVQRMNIMAAMFYLLALLLYIQGRLNAKRRRQWILFSGCFISWMMALGSKEIAATLPLIILVYEWFFFQDLSKKWLKQNFKFLSSALVLVGLVAMIYLHGNPLETILATYTTRDFTLSERVLTQSRVVFFYISLLLWPHPARLNLLHHFTTSNAVTTPITTLFCMVFVLCLFGLSVFLAKKQRIISFSILWFLANLAIESTVIGLEMIYEHRLYLPMFGFCLTVSYILFYSLPNKQSAIIIITIGIILPLSAATYIRNSTWGDTATFWEDCVAKSPRLARPHINLGVEYVNQGRLNTAIKHYMRAIELKPNSSEANNNLGSALARQGKGREAEKYLLRALELKPDYADAHSNLGIALEQQGHMAAAIKQYDKALRINSSNALAHINLGIALSKQGRADEARRHFQQALLINPYSAEANKNMGDSLKKMGRIDEAMRHYNKALKLKPTYPPAHNSLGILYAQKGNLEAARTHFAEALRLYPDYAQAHNNLGKALVQSGRFAESINHFSKALALYPEFASAHNNIGIALVKAGHLDTGITHFRKALEINPGFVNATINLEATLKLKQKAHR